MPASPRVAMGDLPELTMQDSLRSRKGDLASTSRSLTSTGVVAARGDTPPPGFTRDLGLKLPGIADKRVGRFSLTTYVPLKNDKFVPHTHAGVRRKGNDAPLKFFSC